jgi:hypothetical protein
MADTGKCTTLYGATTNLAYTVNQLARTPRPPFSVADQDALSGRSTDVADAARSFRNRDPSDVSDDAVDRGAMSVKRAQVMIDTVNLRLDNGFTVDQLFSAIDTAADDVRGI